MNFRDILVKKAGATTPKPKTPDFNLSAMGVAPGYVQQTLTEDEDALLYTKPGVPPTTVSKGITAIPYFDHVHVAGLLTKMFKG